MSKIASKHSLPDELADLLKGDDEDALVAHAKVLAKFAVTKPAPEKLEGGLDPSDDDDGEMDPRKLARMTRRI